MIEKKHCYRCNRFKPIDGGKMVRRADGQMKWSCAACIELRKPPRKPAPIKKTTTSATVG